MRAVAYRPACPEDAGALAQVHVETWRAAYAGLVPDPYLIGMSVEGQAFRWKKLLTYLPAGQRVRVAVVESLGVVGFTSCGPARGKSPPAPGEVYTLYVQQDWQGQGIGRQLLKGILADLAALGHSSAFLWVLADNPARFFYQRVGGQAVGAQNEAFAGTHLRETAFRWDHLTV